MQSDKYIALNVSNLCDLEETTGNQLKIFNLMVLNMDYSNYIYLANWQKEDICSKVKIAPQTLNNNISLMLGSGLIRAIGRDEFLINKDYAVKGVPDKGRYSKDWAGRPPEDIKELYDHCDELDKRKGYVYAIGHFTSSKKDMSKAFYVGKSCSVLSDRLSSHTKREKNAEAIVIQFNSHGETDYAEKVLINYLKPKKNKELYEGYENEEYAKVLLQRFWEVAKVYETEPKTGRLEKVEIE